MISGQLEERDGALQERIRVVGLGKAGCGIVNRISARWRNGPSVVAIHTNTKVLSASTAPMRIQIGKRATVGLGAGGDPDVGRRAAEDDIEVMRGLLKETDILLLVVGLGGGTGTGAAPVLVRAAQESGTLTLCFAALPFQFEGTIRRARAEKGLRELLEIADMTVIVPNEKLFDENSADASLQETFDKADETVATGMYAVWKMMTRQGLVNIDFADLRNLAQGSGGACALGFGRAAGEDRARAATAAALDCPMLGREKTAAAASVLVSIVGDPSLTLKEVNRIMTDVQAAAAPGGHVFMGAVVDETEPQGLLVSIVASERWHGQTEEAAPKEAQPQQPQAAPAGRHARKSKAEATQPDLGLIPVRKGRFKDVEPTIFDGEDIDVPTFIRRGIAVEK